MKRKLVIFIIVLIAIISTGVVIYMNIRGMETEPRNYTLEEINAFYADTEYAFKQFKAGKAREYYLPYEEVHENGLYIFLAFYQEQTDAVLTMADTIVNGQVVVHGIQYNTPEVQKVLDEFLPECGYDITPQEFCNVIGNGGPGVGWAPLPPEQCGGLTVGQQKKLFVDYINYESELGKWENNN